MLCVMKVNVCCAEGGFCFSTGRPTLMHDIVHVDSISSDCSLRDRLFLDE